MISEIAAVVALATAVVKAAETVAPHIARFLKNPSDRSH